MWMRKNTIYIVELFASLWICGGKKKGKKTNKCKMQTVYRLTASGQHNQQAQRITRAFFFLILQMHLSKGL